MTNADHPLDPIDLDVWNAVLTIRRHHNDAQRRLNLLVTDHSHRPPWEQESPT